MMAGIATGAASLAGCLNGDGNTSTEDPLYNDLTRGRDNIDSRIGQGEHLDSLAEKQGAPFQYLHQQLEDADHTVYHENDEPAYTGDAGDQEEQEPYRHEMTVELNTLMDPCEYVEEDVPQTDAFIDEKAPETYIKDTLEIMVDELWHIRPDTRHKDMPAVEQYTMRLNGREHEEDGILSERDGILAGKYHGSVTYSVGTEQINEMLTTTPDDTQDAVLDTEAFLDDFSQNAEITC